jgi:hypothetical protein
MVSPPKDAATPASMLTWPLSVGALVPPPPGY